MTVTLEESKKLQVEMLKYIRNICEEQGLRYYIAYGTLIGAVRHKGFIPWDDDVDIMMPREDYQKFVEYTNEHKNPKYKVVSIETEKDYTLPLAKMIDTDTRLVQHYNFKEKVALGVYIDIFILDGCGESEETANRKFDECMRWLSKWYKASMKMKLPNKSKLISLLKWVKHSFYRAQGSNYYLKKLKQCSMEYTYDNSNYVGVISYPDYNFQSFWNKNLYGEGTKIDFEGEKFTAPNNYKEVLTSVYGDFMTLPPVEKRVSHHDYDVYWVNK